MSLRRSTFQPHPGLPSWSAPEAAVDDGGVAERPALVVDRGGVVGSVHEIVEMGDRGAHPSHRGSGGLAVRRQRPKVSTQETKGWPQATSMWSLYPVSSSLCSPCCFLEAEVAGSRTSRASIWPRFCVTCRSKRVGSDFRAAVGPFRGRPRLRGGGIVGSRLIV